MTKIMLVEDDNNLREIYQARLAAEGFDIVSSSDGEAALAMAAKEKPDMIISDVMMPKISGFEMLDILRNTDGLKNVKVIMLTALGQAEDSARANSLGADRYLVKSQVTLEDIVKAAHDLLDGDSGETAAAGPIASASGAASVLPAADAPAPDDTATLQPVNEPAAAPDSSSVDLSAPGTAVPAPSAGPVVPDPATPDPAASEPVSPTPAEETAALEASATDIPVAEPPAPKPATTIPVMEAPSDPAPAQVEAAAPSDPLTVNDPAIAPAAEDTSTAESAASTAGPQSAASEEASVKAQIDSFISQQASTETAQAAAADTVEAEAPSTDPAVPADLSAMGYPSAPVSIASPSDNDNTPAAEPEPETFATFNAPVISISDDSQAAPASETAPVGDASTTSGSGVSFDSAAVADSTTTDDNLLAGAANDLSAAATQSAADKAAPVDTADDERDKKVIAPITESKPDINQLLAVEEAKNAAGQAASQGFAAPASPPNVAAYNMPQPAAQPSGVQDVDPNSISL